MVLLCLYQATRAGRMVETVLMLAHARGESLFSLYHVAKLSPGILLCLTGFFGQHARFGSKRQSARACKPSDPLLT